MMKSENYSILPPPDFGGDDKPNHGFKFSFADTAQRGDLFKLNSHEFGFFDKRENGINFFNAFIYDYQGEGYYLIVRNSEAINSDALTINKYPDFDECVKFQGILDLLHIVYDYTEFKFKHNIRRVENQEYYFVNERLVTQLATDNNTDVDIARYNNNNYFPVAVKKLAEDKAKEMRNRANGKDVIEGNYYYDN